MGTSQEVELHKNQQGYDNCDHDSTGNNHKMEDNLSSSSTTTTKTSRRSHSHTWWLRIAVYAVFLVAGQSSATLLGRLYYDKGGNNKWVATLVQSAGFPSLIPLFFFSYKTPSPGPTTTSLSSRGGNDPSGGFVCLGLLYVFFGVLLAGDNMMYSYGLLFLPVSTYSLLCATQLAFNAAFSFFINAQRFTPLVLNSLVVVTVSAALLAVHSDDSTASRVSRGKYVAGFLCTVGASAAYSLYLSLLELSFKRVIKRETFRAVLEMQVYPSFIATCCCVAGLFASGEWRTLKGEMEGYAKGKVSYVMTLVWTALCWQICSVGLLGLTFEVSSLFSNVISTLALPSVPVLGVILFGDKMDGVKVIALVLAVWGFLSYVYQQYLDESKPRRKDPIVV